MKIICVIPARYQSERLPGKPLALIDGRPMIEWVYRRASRAKLISKVYVATDDRRIYDAVTGFGGQVLMTPADLASGSDRAAYVAREQTADILINLQGDEPLILPGLLDKICAVFKSESVQMATLIKKITDNQDLTDPHVVRVVVDKDENALYFSRATIPYLQNHPNQCDWHNQYPFYKHIGLYAYRRDFLIKIAQWPLGNLERAEHLEQLRVLEHGYKIKTVLTEYDAISVDTQEDLKKINAYIRSKNIKMDPGNEAV